MNDGLNKLKLFISTTIMTFMGTMTIQMSFLNVFYGEKHYEAALWLFLALIFSVGFSAAIVYIKRKWIIPLSFFVLMGFYVCINFYEIIGGFGTCFNIVAGAAADYFQTDVLYIYMSPKMLKYGDAQIFCYILAILLPIIFTSTIYYKKFIFIPILIVTAALGIPILFEVFPGFFAILIGIVYCIQLVIISIVPNKITEHNKFSVHVVSIIFGIVLLICGGIVEEFVPSKEFQRSSVFDEIKNWVTNGEFPEWNKESPFAGTIGGGNLGHVNELKFKGASVLTVELPNIKEKIYIKGYIGATYKNSHWEEPDFKDKQIFEDLAKRKYPQQTMVSTYLEERYKDIRYLSGYKAQMRIEYISKFQPYSYIPVYSVYSNKISYDKDEVVSSDTQDIWIEYFIVDEDSFYDSEDTMSGTIYESYQDEYRDYVYKNYLDVNTTMEELLEEMWGDYNIRTTNDRFVLAKSISEYLDKNYTYTTSPGKLPNGKDFVEYFLMESKEGYCTYFATAAVMMFRSAGVPARYVEGYAFYADEDAKVVGDGEIYNYESDSFSSSKVVQETVEYGIVTVKDYNAHAWVEFYVDGVGWIDYEVTPGGGTADVPPVTEEPTTKKPENTTTKEPATTEQTTTNQDATTEDNTAETTTEESQAATGTGDNYKNKGFKFKLSDKAVKILVICFVSILVIALIIFCLIMSHSQVKHKRIMILDDDKKKLTGKSIIMYYELYERLMKKCGFIRQQGMTYTEFAVKMENECYAVGEDEAMRLACLYEKIIYSNEKITLAEINEAEKIYKLIKQRIYENMGSVRKIIFTYILNY